MTPFRYSDSQHSAAPAPNAIVLAARVLFTGAAITAVGFASAPALAQSGAAPESVTKRFDIPPGDLGTALSLAAASAGVQLSFDAALTRGKTTSGVSGTFTAEDAFERLLDGSGLQVSSSGGNTYVLRADASQGDAQVLPAVKVTATADRLFDPPPEQGGFKADFQESATKTPLSIRETPQSITVITRDSIDARQARDLTTALEMAASVIPSNSAGTFAGRGNRAGEGFILRGQFLSGSRDIRNDGFAVASIDNPTDLAVYERVEVVKGASSVLYGQGGVSGFINRIRKKPSAVRAIDVVGQFGSYDTYRTELDANGPLSERLGINGRAIAVLEDAGSFVDGVDSRRALIAPGIEFALGERTRVLAQALYQEDRYRVNPGVPMRQVGMEFIAPKTPRSRFFGVASDDESEGRVIDLTAQIDHELSDHWLASLRLQHNDSRRRNFLDNYGYGLDADGMSTVYSSFNNRDADYWAGELRLNGSFEVWGNRHQLTFGVEHRDVEDRFFSGYASFGLASLYENSFADIETQPGTDAPLSFDSSFDSLDKGVYGQLVLNVFSGTKLITGVRYDRSEIDNTNDISGTRQDVTKDKLTYRIGATQELTQNISVFALYATSFVPITSQGANGILEPETGKGYELGLKSEWFDNKLGATLSVFRQDRDNVPIPDPDDRNFSISAGLQRTDGLELELAGSPIAGLTVGAALSFLDGEHIERDDPSFGTRPFGTVERQSNFYASYELQTGWARGVGFGATLISLGDRYLARDTFVKGYERVDLNLSYKALRRWDLSLQVRNLFDETYLESVNRAAYQNYFGAPRAVLFRAEYRFAL